MLTQLRDRLLGRKRQAPAAPKPAARPAEPDRSDGEEALATEEEQLRETTASGLPRMKTDRL